MKKLLRSDDIIMDTRIRNILTDMTEKLQVFTQT